MIYVDNAATSFPKPNKVYQEMLKCLKEYCANPGRGSHKMSVECSKAILDARHVLAKFFNIPDPFRICFTKNATESINIALHGILKNNDHVIISQMEHNSVLRPLKVLENSHNISISMPHVDRYGEMDIDSLISIAKTRKCKMFMFTFSSNVNGIISPIKKIGEIAKELGILFMIDASQGAGTIPIDVQDMHIDILAFPGHKSLLGPQGTGGLYISPNVGPVSPLMQGGTGSNSHSVYQPDIMPDMLESGTLNTPGIIGLRYGVDFINQVGIDTIRNHKYILVDRLHRGLAEFATIYSKNNVSQNSGIVAFNLDKFDSSEVSNILDTKYDIMCRSGFHCAPSAHKTLGTEKSGIVRLSVGYFNTIDEMDTIISALRDITKKH